MSRKEMIVPALLLLTGACLIGSSEAERYIDQDSLLAIGTRMRRMKNPESMMDFIEKQSEEISDSDDSLNDQEKVGMINALESLLDLRQFAEEERCDDEVGDLVRATRLATAWSHNIINTNAAAAKMDMFVFHWTSRIAQNCIEGVDERLEEARSRLHPATVEGIEGFLADQFLEQTEASLLGDLLDLDWHQVVDRFAARRQNPMDFGPICEDYLREMRSQGALTRAVLIRRPSGHTRQLFIKRTLMRINFCEHFIQPMMPAGLSAAVSGQDD